jgi:hypothetical protein
MEATMDEPVWKEEPPEGSGWFWIYGHWTSPFMIVAYKYRDNFYDFNGRPIPADSTRAGVLWNHTAIQPPESPR